MLVVQEAGLLVGLRAVEIYTTFDDAMRKTCTMRLCWWQMRGRVEAKMKDYNGLQNDCTHGDEAVLGKVSIVSRGTTESLNRRVEEQVRVGGLGMPTFCSS
ncbi:hypothetical protein IG631_03044 [Alternaria alternata]|nr:hypothetical protein IG631_03044 [Alternaria alternata]